MRLRISKAGRLLKTFAPLVRAAGGALFENETPATFGVESGGGQNDGRGCHCFALRNSPCLSGVSSRKRPRRLQRAVCNQSHAVLNIRNQACIAFLAHRSNG